MATKKSNLKPLVAAGTLLPLVLGFAGSLQPSRLSAPPTKPPSSADSSLAPPDQRTVTPQQLLPDSELTPGATDERIQQDNIQSTICNADISTSEVRPPASYTTKLKTQQMPLYDYTVDDPDGLCMLKSNNKACYEEDHLISLQNGGDPKAPENLWPQPYNTMINGVRVGAREKDKVENYIHDEICFGIPGAKHTSSVKPTKGITLARAQQILSTDWYSCYLKLQSREPCE